MIEYSIFPEIRPGYAKITNLQRRILKKARDRIANPDNRYYLCESIREVELSFKDSVFSWLLNVRSMLILDVTISIGYHNTVDEWYFCVRGERIKDKREYRLQWIDKILERGYI